MVNKKGGNNKCKYLENQWYYRLLIITPQNLDRRSQEVRGRESSTAGNVTSLEVLPGQYLEIKTRLQLLMHKDLIDEFENKTFINGFESRKALNYPLYIDEIYFQDS